ncbi:MAG: ribonuclease HIII [Kiritimatiellae bacterium]|nr:ribonuclease HIII [Kiritimatiellia bacterium]
MSQTSFTYELDAAAQERLAAMLAVCSFRPRKVPYSILSFEGEGFNCTLYEKEKHGLRKCLVQGAKAQDFILFYLEPQVLLAATLGYENVIDPERDAPHFGSDESGKGDWFGPLTVACVYVDETTAPALRDMGVRDCKQMTDKAILATGSKIRAFLKPEHVEVVQFNNPAYNRAYFKFRNINRMLAWAHAKAIENLLERVPACKRGVLDQFARTEDVMRRALMPRGKQVELVQRHKAESDIAVAAASVVARERFLRSVERMNEELFGQMPIGGRPADKCVPIGSSAPRVRTLGEEMVRQNGAVWLMNHVKAHFQTTDKVLAACGLSRADLPPEGRVTNPVQP